MVCPNGEALPCVLDTQEKRCRLSKRVSRIGDRDRAVARCGIGSEAGLSDGLSELSAGGLRQGKAGTPVSWLSAAAMDEKSPATLADVSAPVKD